ncbi:MAG: tripartite tricarboxylate transporter substrate binding protein [Xanthobacteraceae bacterium]
MPKLTRRALVVGAIAAPFVAKAEANPAAWPSGPIRLIVPFPPGGSTDVIGRMVQPGLQQRLGINVIVENRPGASGSIGADLVAKSPPDGSTWLLTFDNHAANAFVLPKLPYDTEKDLDPVFWVGTAPYVLCTQSAKPYRSLADVLAAAKARPGQVNYASVGSGSIGHLAMVLLAKQAGVSLLHVPYRGGGPAMNDAIAGHVELLIGSIALAMPQIEPGVLRAVAQMGRRRAAALPDVPTVIESGFPGVEADAWWGFFAPAGTPKPIIDRLGAELDGLFREERIEKQLAESQQVTFVRGGPDELGKFLHEQMQIWGTVVRENGITSE